MSTVFLRVTTLVMLVAWGGCSSTSDSYGCDDDGECGAGAYCEAGVCTGCAAICDTGQTICEAGAVRSCTRASNSCLVWSNAQVCETGTCADGATCDPCSNECASADETVCRDGALSTCTVDDNGCFVTEPERMCLSASCASDSRCALIGDGNPMVIDTGLPPSAFYGDIEVDSLGRPHVSFQAVRLGQGELRYAMWDGGSWQVETADGTQPEVGTVGSGAQMVLDALDRPHIVHRYDSRQALRYTSFNGNAWETSTGIGVDASPDCDIRLDSAGRPVIAYSRFTTDYELQLASFDGAVWTNEQIGYSFWPSQTAQTVSLTLDSADMPHIGVWDSASFFDHYMVVTRDGMGGWRRDEVSEGTNGGRGHMIRDASGALHVTYNSVGFAGFDIRYAYETGNAWEIETIDFGDGPSRVQVASDGRVYIVYFEASRLMLAVRDLGVWQITELDSGAGSVLGLGLAAAIDAEDQLHVIYLDRTNGAVKYIAVAP